MLNSIMHKEIGRALAEKLFRPTGNYNEKDFIFLVDQARRDWIWAKKMVEEAEDHDLIDRAIYYQGAAERRYMYLLKKAAEEKIYVDEPTLVYLALGPKNGLRRRRP